MTRIIILIIFVCSAISAEKKFKIKEVEKHSTPEDCWIVIKDKVYDISLYIPKHPAPESTLTQYCGKIADKGWETKDKASSHSRAAERLLDRFKIGLFDK